MSALGELVLVLAGLHAALGLHWFPRSAYVFRAFVGRRARVTAASSAWGSDRMALLFGPPLPGTGRFHLVELFPLALSRDAIVASPAFDPNPGGRTPRTNRVATWDEAGRARAEGRAVFLGKTRIVTTGSDALARHAARTLARLAALAPAERERAIGQFAREALDADAARVRAQAWEREARTLRFPASLMFLLLFIALPVAGVTVGLSLAWPWLLLALVLLQVWSGVAFFRAHRRLDPNERGERALRTLTVSLSPVEALRSGEVLGRDVLARFHPFAVGAVLLARHEFVLFAERVLRDALHPTPPPAPYVDARVQDVEFAWRAKLAHEILDAAQRAGLERNLATIAPSGDPDERSYCPRCRQTFVLDSGTCADCFGLALAPLPSRAVGDGSPG